MNRHAHLTDSTAVSWSRWLAVIALGISAFAIVTTELAPIGLLSPLAIDFGQTEARAGLIVTAYAWVAAIIALLSATCLGRLPRKPLLVVLMVILALSSLTAAQGSQFITLLMARMVGALAHGVFWTIIGATAAQLVPARRLGLASSIIFGGVSAASVIGVPLASLLTQLSGWRTAFTAIAALSLPTALIIALTVPRIPPTPSLGMQALLQVLRHRTLVALYAVTAGAITAHFAAFTYIEPALSHLLSMPITAVSGLLLIFGLAGIVGNVVSGRLMDRYLKSLVTLALAVIALCLIALGVLPIRSLILPVSLMLIGWGMGIAIVFVGLQTWVLRLAGDAAMPASALHVAIFNAAIGAGALLGGMVITAFGMVGMMVIMAVVVMLSALCVMRLKQAI